MIDLLIHFGPVIIYIATGLGLLTAIWIYDYF
jgi:hypothetical protein